MGISHTADFDQLAEISDAVKAKAIDACMGDLKRLEAQAIRTEYLGEHWPENAPELHLVLVIAREHLRAILDRRGIV